MGLKSKIRKHINCIKMDVEEPDEDGYIVINVAHTCATCESEEDCECEVLEVKELKKDKNGNYLLSDEQKQKILKDHSDHDATINTKKGTLFFCGDSCWMTFKEDLQEYALKNILKSL